MSWPGLRSSPLGGRGPFRRLGPVALRIELLRGRERLRATSAVLQRARRADDTGGAWEAADLQWWWRRARPTDELALPVWFDDSGPAAAVGLTAWDPRWQVDVFAAPGVVDRADVWSAALDLAEQHRATELEVLIREDDEPLLTLAREDGFEGTSDRSGITWMAATDRPPAVAPPDGFAVVDRTLRAGRPHPMIDRNGGHVEARLRQCPLYEPTLDLSVEAPDGAVAGYALFWLDRVTGVGMLEPMRVDGAHRRRGLGRALLGAGLEKLATMGAHRLKVGFDGEAGRRLYLGAGFLETATLRSFSRSVTPELDPTARDRSRHRRRRPDDTADGRGTHRCDRLAPRRHRRGALVSDPRRGEICGESSRTSVVDPS